MRADDDLWTLTFRVVPGRTPARSRINHLLKHAAKWGLVCVRLDEPEEMKRLRQQVEELSRLSRPLP